MAHAWKACWVKALRGSNPLSSAFLISRHIVHICLERSFIFEERELVSVMFRYRQQIAPRQFVLPLNLFAASKRVPGSNDLKNL